MCGYLKKMKVADARALGCIGGASVRCDAGTRSADAFEGVDDLIQSGGNTFKF